MSRRLCGNPQDWSIAVADIVEDLRLLHSGAQWADKATADTLEEAANEIERLRGVISSLGRVDDLRKAAWYIGREIARREDLR